MTKDIYVYIFRLMIFFVPIYICCIPFVRLFLSAAVIRRSNGTAEREYIGSRYLSPHRARRDAHVKKKKRDRGVLLITDGGDH